MAVDVAARPVQAILEHVLEGGRLEDDDAATLLRSRDLVSVGRAADEMRSRKSDPDEVTYIVDRNINYTNVCITDCDFCAFYRRPGDTREGYVLPKPIIHKKIEETLALGGTAVLMQGGHHPDLGIEWYEDLLRGIKSRYKIHLHALSPPEIQHISRRSRLTVAETLSRLRDSGLDSLPGGGGEILVDRVRKIIAPKKTKTADWLGVHARGAPPRHVDHRDDDVRPRRDARGARRAPAPHPRAAGRDARLHARSSRGRSSPTTRASAQQVKETPTSFDYLRTQAVSRLYLDNVDHIQASWVTQGLEDRAGRAALRRRRHGLDR